MDLKEILTLLLASYAAVLSTILGIHEIRNGVRRITIFLTHGIWSGSYEIIITNTGQRPITITSITVLIPPTDQVRHNLLTRIMQGDQELSFPFTLYDGDTAGIYLNDSISTSIKDANENISISVYDSEGKEYHKYKRARYDAKYGHFTS